MPTFASLFLKPLRNRRKDATVSAFHEVQRLPLRKASPLVDK